MDLVPSVLGCEERCLFTMYYVITPMPHAMVGSLAEVGKYPSSCPRLTPIVRKKDNNSIAFT